MKTLIASAFCLFAFAASAQDYRPEYYKAEFSISKVSPMCPSNIPDGAVCMGLGSLVEVQAPIGCKDQVVFKEFSVVRNFNEVEIHAVALVKKHAKADVIRCRHAQVIREIVPVHEMGPVRIINSTIDL